jgi:branched-chain amino acid transport system permease protein
MLANSKPAALPAAAAARLDWRRAAPILLMAFVLAFPCLAVPEFWVMQMNYIGMYSLVVLGVVLLSGVGGLISFGQAAFVGLGAYATGYLTTQLGLSPWLGLLAGLALTLVVASILALVTLRMSGHYLPLATICWCLALYFAMGNLEPLGKHDGLMGIPPLSIGGLSLQPAQRIYYLIWGCAMAAAAAVTFLLDSRAGRIMRALNAVNGGGTTMPEAMGASTYRHKVAMFLIAAVLASISGWLFAHTQRTVNPSPFGIKMGIEYLLMAVVGGMGSVYGAFLGAAVVKIAEDQLQVLLPRLFGSSGSYEVVLFGMALVAILHFAPKGLWPLIAGVFRRPARPMDWAGAPELARRPRPPAGSAILRLQGLEKRFGGLTAVGGVSFEVAAGEIVGLIGPNGAGKSTTFNLISGVLPLSAGEVWFEGRQVERANAAAMARRGLSRTFQHVKLVAEMSVLENVAIGAYLRGRSGVLKGMLRLDRDEERRVLREAERQIRRIGMAASMHMLAGDLSLGQQRMVEIARALAGSPSVLLLDEPAAGLRHFEKEALGKVLRGLTEEGMSLVLVEHDMDFVMGLCDRIVVMESGMKLMEGSPRQVQGDPAVRAAYLGMEH